jgi:hypothetical protein
MPIGVDDGPGVQPAFADGTVELVTGQPCEQAVCHGEHVGRDSVCAPRSLDEGALDLVGASKGPPRSSAQA